MPGHHSWLPSAFLLSIMSLYLCAAVYLVTIGVHQPLDCRHISATSRAARLTVPAVRSMRLTPLRRALAPGTSSSLGPRRGHRHRRDPHDRSGSTRSDEGRTPPYPPALESPPADPEPGRWAQAGDPACGAVTSTTTGGRDTPGCPGSTPRARSCVPGSRLGRSRSSASIRSRAPGIGPPRGFRRHRTLCNRSPQAPSRPPALRGRDFIEEQQQVVQAGVTAQRRASHSGSLLRLGRPNERTPSRGPRQHAP